MKRTGFGMIETIISMAVAAILLTVFMTILVTSSHASRLYLDDLKANLYLTEIIEIAKDLEGTAQRSASKTDLIANWAKLTCATKCYPITNASKWELIENIDGENLVPVNGTYIFNRSLEIEAVYRNDDNNIDSAGTNLDLKTKKVVAEICWKEDCDNHKATLKIYVYIYEEPVL